MILRTTSPPRDAAAHQIPGASGVGRRYEAEEISQTVQVVSPTPSPPPSPSGATPLFDSSEARERTRQAEDIVRGNTLWALGAGAFAVPVVDALAATAVQLKLIKNLSDLYGVKFSERLTLKLVSALLAGSLGTLWGMSASSLAKLVPGIGSALGSVAGSLTAAAFTHALGQVFIVHFESGGTLLDFDPKRVREHFKREYEQSLKVVERMRGEQSTPETK